MEIMGLIAVFLGLLSGAMFIVASVLFVVYWLTSKASNLETEVWKTGWAKAVGEYRAKQDGTTKL